MNEILEHNRYLSQSADVLSACSSNGSALEFNVHRGFRLVNKHEAAGILGVSPETLKRYRLQDGSPLIEGVHYHVWNSRTIRYNPTLLADWALNRNNPVAHQRAIEAYLAALSPRSKRGRRSSQSTNKL